MGGARIGLGAAVAAAVALSLAFVPAATMLLTYTVGERMPTVNTVNQLFKEQGHIVGPIALRLGHQHIKRKLLLARSAVFYGLRGRRMGSDVTTASLGAMCSSATYDADMRALVNTHFITFDVAFRSAPYITRCVCGDGDPAKTLNLRGNIALLFNTATAKIDLVSIRAARKRKGTEVIVSGSALSWDGRPYLDHIYYNFYANAAGDDKKPPFLDTACEVGSCGQALDFLISSIIDEVFPILSSGTEPAFGGGTSGNGLPTGYDINSPVSDALCTGPVIDKCFADGCDTCIYTLFAGDVVSGGCTGASECYPCLNLARCLSGAYGSVGSIHLAKPAVTAAPGKGTRCEKAACYAGGTCVQHANHVHTNPLRRQREGRES